MPRPVALKAGCIALRGYVAEQKAVIALEKAGHIVQFAPTPNQQAWDLLVDGHPWQVKEGNQP
jgi:hypothetical protein